MPPRGRERRRRPREGAAPRSLRSAGRRSLGQVELEPVQRALDVADRAHRHAGVERRGLQLCMAEQHLDHPDVGALFKQWWVAKLCRKVCGDTRLAMPARSLAAWTARLSWRAVTGLIGFWPGNSQTCGRAAFHHSRRSWSSWGDSIT